MRRKHILCNCRLGQHQKSISTQKNCILLNSRPFRTKIITGVTATANFSIYGTWLANESREPIPPYYTFCTSLQTPNCSRLETDTHGWMPKPYLLVCLELHFVIQARLQPMVCDVTHQPMRNFHCSPTRTAFALTAESSKEGGQWISHSRPADLRPKDPRTHRSVNHVRTHPTKHPPS